MTYTPAQGWIVHYTPSTPDERFAFHVVEECARRHAASMKASAVRVVGPMALSDARMRFLVRECTNCVPRHQVDMST